ncbi:MAG TPA: outer membrane chaperone Skp [Cytophagales bacterium]|nr:outer membrane chaperone Skp [Cytophagales bacterium]HAA24326.1 outer membrane chaperone Skp [Cytophagales bacterium]HAP63983.1 outer membrane chaperone Skp [Cytophagales bacterium]
MKKQASLLVITLLTGASFLMVQCSDQGAAGTTTGNTVGTSAGSSSVASSIAYIVLDSVSANYSFWAEQIEKLTAHGEKLQRELDNRVRGFQQEVANLEQAAQNRTMTQNQLLAAQDALGQKQQNLQQYQQNIQVELAQMEAEAMNEVYDKIETFLKKYGESNDLDLILTYQRGSGIWYAKEGMNITDSVIEGLNDEHEIVKNGGSLEMDSSEADSTAQDTTGAE